MPRALETAAQTHSCDAISAAIAQARRRYNWRSAIRSRECRARGRLQRKPIASQFQHIRACVPAVEIPAQLGFVLRPPACAALQHSCDRIAERQFACAPAVKTPAPPQSDQGSAACPGGCSTNTKLRQKLSSFKETLNPGRLRFGWSGVGGTLNAARAAPTPWRRGARFVLANPKP